MISDRPGFVKRLSIDKLRFPVGVDWRQPVHGVVQVSPFMILKNKASASNWLIALSLLTSALQNATVSGGGGVFIASVMA